MGWSLERMDWGLMSAGDAPRIEAYPALHSAPTRLKLWSVGVTWNSVKLQLALRKIWFPAYGFLLGFPSPQVSAYGQPIDPWGNSGSFSLLFF